MDLDLHREILSTLEYVYAGRKEVRLHNGHKGMPISYPATIQGFNDRGIIFKINKYQLVCLALDKQTFIQSDLLPSIVKAKLIDLDYPRAQVTLQHFIYTLDTIGKRELIRVQPQEPVQVNINDRYRKIKGTLVDISEVGIGVQTLVNIAYSSSLIRQGTAVQVSFRLPGETVETFMTGNIRSIAKEIQAETYRLGILISPNTQAREAIVRYISKRKTRILAELDALYSQLSQEKLP
jgi:hypothetical protein